MTEIEMALMEKVRDLENRIRALENDKFEKVEFEAKKNRILRDLRVRGAFHVPS
jgi:hypothetical protein